MFSLSAQTPRKDSGADGLFKLLLKGEVVSALDGKPINGVTITAIDGKEVSSSKKDGSFMLSVQARKGKVSFTHLGYKQQELNYTVGVSMSVNLIPEDNRLDETVVIGYGTTTRRLSTGAVTKVSASEIAHQPISNPLEALRGKVPGLLITQNNGGNGAGFKVQLRGQSSFSQGSDPLFIVDGIPFSTGINNLNQLSSSSGSTEAGRGMSPLNLINPNDIESIEVLKDADATAIYGSRGANGVILITTKKAKNIGQTFDLNVYKGWQQPNRSMKMMGREEYLQMRREAFRQDNIEPTAQNAPDLMLWDTVRHTDFEKLLIGNTAHVLDAQLAYGQRSELSNIQVRGSYRNEGNLMSKDLKSTRYGLFMSSEIKSKDRKFMLSAITTFASSKNNLNATDLSTFVNTIPTLKIYNDRGLNWEEAGVDYYSLGYPDLNPLKFREERYTATFQNLNSSLQLNYILPEEIMLKVNGGYNLTNGDETALFPSKSINPYSGILASSQFGHRKSSSWIIEPQLSKNFKWRDWNITLLLGGTLQDLYTASTSVYGMDYKSDMLLESLAAAGYQYGNTGRSNYRYMGIYGRGTVNYRSRYIVNISGRRDGSSRFAPEARFSNFGAVGAAWLLSEESFFKLDRAIVSFAKLRASYGVTGNDQIGDYKYLETWEPQQNGTYQGVPTIRPVSLFNRNYAWERNRKLEIGADLGFFKDRFFLSLGYYRNLSDNQLINYTLPNQTGFASILKNLDAVVLNRGLEAAMDGQLLSNRNFSWKTSMNFSLNRNKLVDFPGLSTSSYKNSYIIGSPLNIRRTYRYLGVNSQSGLYEIADSNGDQIYSQEDKIMVTELDPKFMGGWYNTITYGQFSIHLGVDFRKQKGINYLGSLGAAVPGYGLVNQPAIALQRWQQPGDAAMIQRYTAGSTEALTAAFNMRQSDAIYSDASFIRLRNVALYYQFSKNMLNSLRLTNMKLFMQGENIHTWTGYRGSDPETQNLMALPPLRTITVGLNVNL